MADLVAKATMETHLGIAADSDARVEPLLDGAEALFEQQTNRTRYPFQAAETDRTDILRGTGGTKLFVPYPIADISETIKLGRDTSNPVETLDPTDVDVVVWTAGTRLIERVDAGVWGEKRAAHWVHLTYDTQDDLPLDAQLAVKSLVATVFRQLGSEDAKSERLPDFSHTLRQAAADDPLWQMAVAANRRYHAGF